MIVSSLENAKLALMHMLISDEASKDFQALMEDFFAFSNQTSIEIKNLSTKSNHAFKTKFNELEKYYLNEKHALSVELQHIVSKNQSTNDLTRSKYSQDIASIEAHYIQEKKEFEAKLIAFETNFKSAIKTYQQNYNKTVSVIKKQRDSIKTTHNKHMGQIEAEKLKRIEAITVSFNARILEIQTKQQEIAAIFKERLTALQHVRQLQSKAHDDDYIMIKTHFSTLLKSLNTHINHLKALKLSSMKSIETYYTKQQIPFHDALNAYEKNYLLELDRIKHTFNETSKRIHLAKKELIKAHQNETYKIQASISQAVSLLNSKLSSFRELTESKKIEIMKQFHAKSEQEKQKDISSKNQALRRFDSELNQLIISVRKKIKQRKIEGQVELFEANKSHQIALNDLLFELKNAQLTEDFDLRKNDLLFEQYKKQYENEISRIENSLSHHLELLESNFNQEMLRFETQLNIATESQERDLNQLSQDVFIDITSTDIEIETLEHVFDLDALKEKNDLEDAKLIHAFELDSIEQETKRLLERENLIKSLLLEEQTLRENLAKNIESRQIIDDEKKFFTEKAQLLKAIDIHEHTFQFQISTLKANFDFEISKIELSRLESDIKTSLHYDLINLQQLEKIHALRMEEQYEVIKHTLNETLNRQLLIGKLKQFIYTLNNKPAHPELIRQFLTYVNVYISETQALETNAFSVCETRVIEYNQLHVKDVTHRARIEAIKQIDIEHLDAKKNIEMLENDLNQNIYDIELSIKQQKQSQVKDDLKYQKLKKDKLAFVKQYAALEKERDKKIIILDKKLSIQSTSALSYTTKLEQLFKNLIHTSQLYFKQQLQSIQSIQNELYITETILDQHLKTSFKHDDMYHQKLVSISQQQYNVLLAQYQHAIKLETQDKAKREMLFNASLEMIKKKYEDKHSILKQQTSSYTLELDTQSKNLHAHTLEKIKVHQNESNEKSKQLSKLISKDESTLQDFTTSYQKTLDYFDLNTLALKDKDTKQHLLNIEALHTAQKEKSSAVISKHQNSHDQLLSKVKSTELNIENKLYKYRLKVSKLRESLATREQNNLSERFSLRKVFDQKEIAHKQNTKSLLSKHEKEVMTFESLRQQGENKLTKLSNQREKQMIKTVSRGHRFKSRMLDFS
jgi:hypothetical protein